MSLDASVPPAVEDHWEDLLADCEATADDYRERGWETLVVHTGDVTALTDDPWGIDVLAPDDEFADLRALVEGATFEDAHVLRTEAGGVRFLAVVLEAPETERVVVVPAYLVPGDEYVEELEERALAEETLYTHVRTLSNDERVTFSHDDPELFL